MKHEKEYKNSLQPLLKWLTGDANRHDEMALDAQVKDDPFLADTIEGYRSMPEADHAADVTRLKARLRQKSERRRGAGFYLLRIAAVGAVLVAAWLVLQQFQSSEKAAAMADAVRPEAGAPAAETQAQLTDSVDFSIASQEKTTASAADDRVAVQGDYSPKTKNEAPQPNAAEDSYFFSDLDKTGEAEAGAPPPVTLMDNKPAPTQPTDTDEAIAIEENQAAPQKDEDLSMAKARTEASKRADSAPAAKPGAPVPRKIIGKVTDENGDPLIGASAMVINTGIGTITDVDGRYAIEVPASAESLVFSYTGYSQVQVTLGNKDRLDVKLSESDLSLSEVVVTGYSVSGGEPATVESPRPADGFKQYKKYVADNLRHPEASKQPRPRQVVRVRFTLLGDGSLSNFVPKGDAPQAYKDEAMRLLREGSRWNGTPGTMASYRFVFE